MPLYEHIGTGERVRTVAGSHEDHRLRASPRWNDPHTAPPAPHPEPEPESSPAEAEDVDDVANQGARDGETGAGAVARPPRQG